MTAYYNEFDPQAAEWLRILILQGNIAPGFVDERSITEVDPDELRQYTQCHFFAGIGGWSYALRLAGWPDDRPCWTGSPPCQPFSNAGKRNAQSDARHLWPVFFNLVSKCRPANIFGEQVEAAIRTGWLDDLQDDLEAEGYATGKIVLPACGFGAPHIRQRIWFVAERLADTDNERSQGRAGMSGADELSIGEGSLVDGLADDKNAKCECAGRTRTGWEGFADDSDNGGLAKSEAVRLQRGSATENSESSSRENGCANKSTRTESLLGSGTQSADAPDSIWRNPDWLFCRDGKWRPVESGTFPLAHGLQQRVGLLRGYGNAIVPQVAAEVIRAYMES